MKTQWKLDPTHSDFTFKVRHMMISNVKGSFTDFSVVIETEDDSFKNAKSSVIIQAASIATHNNDRDNHLKSADFLDVENYPTITFEGTNDSGQVTGELTIHGVTKTVSLEVDFNGTNIDPYGSTRAGFSFEGKINRKDFGLTWNAALEAGGVMIGEDVHIAGELQFIKEA